MSKKRFLIKISGEALANSTATYDPKRLESIIHQLDRINSEGYELAIVVGGGNIWRGRNASKVALDPVTSDYMGMMGTIMNALWFQSQLYHYHKVQTIIFAPFAIPNICKQFNRQEALTAFANRIILIFAAGTGNPFFSTDTGAALKAAELNVDAILMGKNGVDGVYDDDPKLNPHAKLIPALTYREMILKKLAVMDLTAASICLKTEIPTIVFNIDLPDSIYKTVHNNHKLGTIITAHKENNHGH